MRLVLPISLSSLLLTLYTRSLTQTEWFTKTLGNLVSNVIVSNRLVKSPAMLTVTEYGWTGNMERINKAQSFQGNEALQQSNIPKKIFEYNPWHPIIAEIDKRRTENPDDAELKDMALILFDNAAVVSGFTLTGTVVLKSNLSLLITKLSFSLVMLMYVKSRLACAPGRAVQR